MKKRVIFAILSLCSLFFAPRSNAQGNLQFNQVLTHGGNLNGGSITSNVGTFTFGSITYTVPSGKVWKVEIVSATNNTTNVFVNNFSVAVIGNTISSLTPIWLKSGDALRIGGNVSSGAGYFLSIIEFNVVP